MTGFRCGVLGLGVMGVAVAAFGADDGSIDLREPAKVGATTRVLITLKADGLYRPGPPPAASNSGAAAAKADAAKPLALKVETRLEFVERVVGLGPGERARRAVRKVVQAASAINGDVRPSASALRPEVSLLVADVRPTGVVVASPSGPLTRSELELVQGVGDPLALADLLPPAPVKAKAGESWRVGNDAARALSAYDHVIDNGMKATLGAVADDSVTVALNGEVRGNVLGAEGRMIVKGEFVFDRKAGRITTLTLKRSEARRPGAVEAGLDVQSTLTVSRKDAEAPSELTDEALAAIATDPDPERELLLLVSPGGQYRLRHDRDWHTYWQDARLTVLKRLGKEGVVVAQCNLMKGPNAGKGRHQDLEQFRSDVRRVLGNRFVEFHGEGELDEAGDDLFRYKVGVRGREGEVGIVWDYYLIASAAGDQLLATFTLAENHAKSFGDQDQRLIRSLRWNDAAAPNP